MMEKREQDRVMKFRMGLNEAHHQVRSQTLAMDPLPSVKEIYNVMRRNEKQQDMQRNTHLETSALYVAPRSNSLENQYPKHQNNFTYNGNQYQNREKNYEERKSSFCTYCQMKGHSKEKCYRLHDYPSGYRNNRRSFTQQQTVQKGQNHYTNSAANNVVIDSNVTAGDFDKDETQNNQMSLGGIKMSQEQINKLMNLVNAMNAKEPDTTILSGITCLTSISMNKNDWIVDSGATEHITPYAELLREVRKLSIPYTVVLPNGDQVSVTCSGKCTVSENIDLNGVLLVPEIKFNLLNVSKLIMDSNVTVTFTDQGCYTQDRVNQTSQWISKLDGKLFQMTGSQYGVAVGIKTNKNVMTLSLQKSLISGRKLTPFGR